MCVCVCKMFENNIRIKNGIACFFIRVVGMLLRNNCLQIAFERCFSQKDVTKTVLGLKGLGQY